MNKMKRYIAFAAALLTIAACQPNERAYNGNKVFGLISDFTRTELGEDGLSVTWCEGDTIGVAVALSGNYPFVLSPETAGKTEGAFIGIKTLTGEPVSAYYPYNPSAPSSSIKSVEMTLPEVQTQKGDAPDMRNDVKMASAPSGTEKSGYVFDFKQKLALLKFEFIPDASFAGDSLVSISLQIKGRDLAGTYKMSLTDATAALSFTSPVSKVTLEFADKPAFAEGETIIGWMFVAAGAEQDDAIKISVETARTKYAIEGTAAKNWEEGFRYVMTLDVASLKSKAKIYEDVASEGGVPMGTVFTDITTPGAYDISSSPIMSIVMYTEGEDQYSNYSSGSYIYYTILNVEKGYALKSNVSKSAAVGSTYSYKTAQMGLDKIPNATTSGVKCVKIDGSLYWFEDSTNNIGYILSKE